MVADSKVISLRHFKEEVGLVLGLGLELGLRLRLGLELGLG